MPVNIPLTSSLDALFEILSATDLTVPGRTEGRTTDHTETWTICRLVSTLAKAELLTLPISVGHRDRPDFLIQDERRMIGVEVTEAISQQYAAYCALAEREFPDALLEMANFRWDSPNRTVEEMRALLRQNQLTSDGWAGNDPEREWALFIKGAVDVKLKKLAHPGFMKFEHNWLSIYDNLPMPNIHLADAINFLRPLLASCWSRNPSFDKIFIEHGPVIACITSNGSDHLILKDLWE